MLCEMANSLRNIDIDISYKSLFLVSKLFGLIPLSVPNTEIGKQEKFPSRISDVTLITVWSVRVVTLLSWDLYMVIHSILSVPQKIKILTTVCGLLIPLTKILMTITINFLNTGNITKAIKKFSAVDEFIERQKDYYV
jgi:hypothetical protein